MPDITKCHGFLFSGEREQCPLKSKCYRYTVKGEKSFQPYFFIAAYEELTNACHNFQAIPEQTNAPDHDAAISDDSLDRRDDETDREFREIIRPS